MCLQNYDMDNLLNLVYADHVRQIINERQCDIAESFSHLNDIKVIRDFIRELRNCDFPREMHMLDKYVVQNGERTN